MSEKHILVVDDEEEIRDLIEYNLLKEGYLITVASNGEEAMEMLNKHKIDLVLLDVMMPGMDGIEVCSLIRKNNDFNNVIICFLTARNEDYSQIAGFDAGADDYIAKPVKPRILKSRIQALLRRVETPSKNESDSLNELVIDRDKYKVTLEGEDVHLPRKEFELLALLASRPGSVFERDYILEQVWGTEIVVGDRTIDVHVRKLREKIGSDYIKTVKGVGYKFITEKDSY